MKDTKKTDDICMLFKLWDELSDSSKKQFYSEGPQDAAEIFKLYDKLREKYPRDAICLAIQMMDEAEDYRTLSKEDLYPTQLERGIL